MNVCPNISSPEWNKLVDNVGLFEAYRDFFETDGLIRDPNTVLNKLKRREAAEERSSNLNEDPSFVDIYNEFLSDVQSDPEAYIQQTKNSKAIDFANQLSNSLNVEYEIITPDEALLITKDSVNPWNGQAGFFFNGKVYFIKDRLTTDLVFHEFSHPFVRAISVENPQLFDSLYAELMSTAEGLRIQEELIAKGALEPGSNLFKEEAIVIALTQASINKVTSDPRPSSFKEFIKTLLFNFKQFLRRVFGKDIQVSELDSDTTLNQLASILSEGGKIEYDPQIITNEDVVAYYNQVYDEIVNDIDNIRNADMQMIINRFYDTTTSHIKQLLKNDNYEELAFILTDQYSRGDLQAMKSNLAQWQSTIKRTAEDILADLENTKNRSQALANNLVRLDSVMSKINNHVKDISRREDSQDNMHKAYYYEKLIKHWREFMDSFTEVIRDSDNNVPENSSIAILSERINRNMENAQKTINKMHVRGARDVLFEELSSMNQALQERFDNYLALLESKGAPPKAFDDAYIEFHGMTREELGTFNRLIDKKNKEGITKTEEKELIRLTQLSKDGVIITKNKIEMILEGNLGDSNWYNSMLEGYLYNTDPVIGGLALFIKNNYTDMMIVTQRNYNDFIEDIREDIEKLGIGFSNIGGLGRLVGFKDKIAKRNSETNLLEEAEVWTFLDRFKNYRMDYFLLKDAADKAKLELQLNNNRENELAYQEAKSAFDKFLRTYFNQEYVPEFYQRYELLERDAVGKHAAYLREQIFEDINLQVETAKSEESKLELVDYIDVKLDELRQLASLYEPNGQPKSEEVDPKLGFSPAELARRIREYNDMSKGFYESVLIKGSFETAYYTYREELLSKMSESDPAFQEAMDNWITKNTRKVIKSEYFEKRQELIDKITNILNKLPKPSKDEVGDSEAVIDQSIYYEKLFDLVGNSRDSDGQIDGTDIPSSVTKTIKEITLALEELKSEEIKASGLTSAQSKRLSELIALGNKANPEQVKEKLKLIRLRSLQGLNRVDLINLRKYYKDLGELSSNEPTDYYLSTLNNYLGKSAGSKFFNTFQTNTADKLTAEVLLDPEYLEDLFAENPEFEAWFKENHILTERFDPEAKGNKYRPYYKRLFHWSVTKPSNPNMYEKFEIYDDYGNVTILDRMPASRFYYRKVKDEFKTRKVVGVTVDNQFNWLPKSKEDMAKNTSLSDEDKYKYINQEYENLKVQNPDMFNLLEKLKRWHLANQEGLPVTSRLYLDMPRFRQEGLEVLQTTDPIKKAKERGDYLSKTVRRVKEFFKGKADQMEDGLTARENLTMVKADFFDNDFSNLPIAGLYDLDVDDVSTNITETMMRYMASAERQKKLVQMNPVIRGIQSALANNKIKDFNKVDATNLKNRNILSFLPKGDNIRLKAVNNLIEREFEGKLAKGDTAWANNITSLLFKRASFAFFALNIPSALKNSLGMKFQSMIEASAGTYVNHKSLQKGNLWSYKAMSNLSFSGQLYQKGALSHDLQIMEIFDFMQDRFIDKFSKGKSRTILKDITEMSWLYSPRKWVELQATMQLGAGMLYHKKVKIKVGNETQEIDYIDAFETVDGRIRLKEGVDVRYAPEAAVHVIQRGDSAQSIAKKYNIPLEEAENAIKGDVNEILEEVEFLEYQREVELDEINVNTYSSENERAVKMDKRDAINKRYDEKIAKVGTVTINNSEFKFMKNRIQQVVNNMGGAYAKFDQPEAQRYLGFRMISYLRRYFTTMALNRWGFSGSIRNPKARFNPGLGDSSMGFYIQFGKLLAKTIQNKGKNLSWMSEQEKAATLRFMSEMVFLILVLQLQGILFGWDPEDEDRYAKLREQSGPMNLLGLVSEQPGREFDLFGFLELHSLHLLMQVRAENEQFNLLTGGVQQYSSLLDLKSIAFGPTTDTYVEIYNDWMNLIQGNPSAYYTRRVGPYEWQDQESLKLFNRMAKTFGMTGSSIDPALAIQNFQSFQAKVKR